jgi:hydroxypyruvate isomerase
MGYTGPVGMEAWASGDPEAALQAFRAAFTVSPDADALGSN